MYQLHDIVPFHLKICRGHLTKCINFENRVSENERKEILARKVPEDDKKAIKKQKLMKRKGRSGLTNF